MPSLFGAAGLARPGDEDGHAARESGGEARGPSQAGRPFGGFVVRWEGAPGAQGIACRWQGRPPLGGGSPRSVRDSTLAVRQGQSQWSMFSSPAGCTILSTQLHPAARSHHRMSEG